MLSFNSWGPSEDTPIHIKSAFLNFRSCICLIYLIFDFYHLWYACVSQQVITNQPLDFHFCLFHHSLSAFFPAKKSFDKRFDIIFIIYEIINFFPVSLQKKSDKKNVIFSVICFNGKFIRFAHKMKIIESSFLMKCLKL